MFVASGPKILRFLWDTLQSKDEELISLSANTVGEIVSAYPKRVEQDLIDRFSRLAYEQALKFSSSGSSEPFPSLLRLLSIVGPRSTFQSTYLKGLVAMLRKQATWRYFLSIKRCIGAFGEPAARVIGSALQEEFNYRVRRRAEQTREQGRESILLDPHLAPSVKMLLVLEGMGRKAIPALSSIELFLFVRHSELRRLAEQVVGSTRSFRGVWVLAKGIARGYSGLRHDVVHSFKLIMRKRRKQRPLSYREGNAARLVALHTARMERGETR